MKKLWIWIKKNKDYFAWSAHALWLAVNLVHPEFADKTEQIIGHSVIGGFTTVGIYDRAKRNKDVINNSIDKAKNVFKKTPSK